MTTVRKTITLSEINVKNFERYYPESNLSWALDLLLEKLIEQFDHTAAEYAAIAVEAMKDEVSER